MTYAAHFGDLAPYLRDKHSHRTNPVAKTVNILRRAVNAILASRQRQADREIARFFAQSGGRLTDNLEREMTQRFLLGRNTRW
jgi:hypothetical protein